MDRSGVADLPLLALDRAVRDAARDMERHAEALAVATTEVEDRPLATHHRAVSGRAALRQLEARAASPIEEPHKKRLVRWMSALTVWRVSEEARSEEALAEGKTRLRDAPQGPAPVSYRSAWHGVLSARTVALGTPWLGLAVLHAPEVDAVRRKRVELEREALHRLDASSWTMLLGREPIGAHAEEFLRETADLARSISGVSAGMSVEEGIVARIHAPLARDAMEGWPRRPTARALLGIFKDPAAIRGLRIEMASPQVFGASSFALALARLGAFIRRAAARAGSVPFALAEDPWSVDAAIYGAAFGALPGGRVFLRRALGLSSRTAEKNARSFARAALFEARRAAALALAHEERWDRSRWSELLHDIYGPLPSGLWGAFPRVPYDAPARFEGVLRASEFTRDLTDRFDDDWFLNPRAWPALLARGAAPTEVPETPLDSKALARAFERALG